MRWVSPGSCRRIRAQTGSCSGGTAASVSRDRSPVRHLCSWAGASRRLLLFWPQCAGLIACIGQWREHGLAYLTAAGGRRLKMIKGRGPSQVRLLAQAAAEGWRKARSRKVAAPVAQSALLVCQHTQMVPPGSGQFAVVINYSANLLGPASTADSAEACGAEAHCCSGSCGCERRPAAGSEGGDI